MVNSLFYVSLLRIFGLSYLLFTTNISSLRDLCFMMSFRGTKRRGILKTKFIHSVLFLDFSSSDCVGFVRNDNLFLSFKNAFPLEFTISISKRSFYCYFRPKFNFGRRMKRNIVISSERRERSNLR